MTNSYILLYSVHYLAIVREASPCSRWEQIQRPETQDFREREKNREREKHTQRETERQTDLEYSALKGMDVFIKSLPSGLR